jgi:F-type H+-transporting ATPase subunit b
MSLLSPDPGLLFWMLVSFGIVVFILTKFGFPEILKMIDERREFITESLLEAQKAREESEKLRKESATLINKANREQLRIINEATKSAQEIVHQAGEAAKKEGERMIEKARQTIEKEKEEAMRDVQRIIATLSVDVAEKLIKTQLDTSGEQMELINRLIDEMYINKS